MTKPYSISSDTMQTFEEYSGLFEISCDTSMLDFCSVNKEYCIYEGQKPLLTPGGNPFSHPSGSLIRMIITDLQLADRSGQGNLQSPLLYSFMKDILDNGEDPFLRQWDGLVNSDPFIRLKISGNPAFQPFGPDEPLFAFSFISLSGLLESVNRFAGKIMGEISLEESETHPFPPVLKQFYLGLPVEQKAVVQALNQEHRPGVVMPLLFVSGEVSSVEYAKGLISMRIRQKEQFSEILAGLAKAHAWLDCRQHKSGKEKQLAAMIKEGEGDSVEFKSTLRWDIRAGKTNPAIERACLKTIAAFLNSSGGTLLIGVRYDGSVEGIETDKFPNEDKFLLHLWTLIRACLGKDFSPYIRTRLEKTDDKTVCLVSCLPSNRPVFLRQPGFNEEMYIRVGPSSNAMDISEALKYIEDHYSQRIRYGFATS
jgi:hypothetical protein